MNFDDYSTTTKSLEIGLGYLNLRWNDNAFSYRQVDKKMPEKIKEAFEYIAD